MNACEDCISCRMHFYETPSYSGSLQGSPTVAKISYILPEILFEISEITKIPKNLKPNSNY